MDDRTRRLHDQAVSRVESFYRLVRIGRWIAFAIALLFVAWVILRVM